MNCNKRQHSRHCIIQKYSIWKTVLHISQKVKTKNMFELCFTHALIQNSSICKIYTCRLYIKEKAVNIFFSQKYLKLSSDLFSINIYD